MPKPFLTFDAQISYLENDKNLVIQDHDYAKTMLKQIGYFSLIGGYKAPFKNTTTRKYKDGTRFEDIVALYFFDENLREFFLKYILKIERHTHRTNGGRPQKRENSPQPMESRCLRALFWAVRAAERQRRWWIQTMSMC